MKLDPGLNARLADLVSAEGLELLAVEVVGRGAHTILRLVLDGPEGVSLDDCTRISREASALLDVEDPFRHAYTLEVSSPGLDRKLYRSEDYERFRGERVKVRMQPSFREHRVVVGELVGLEGPTVRVRPDRGEVIELPAAEVLETRLEVDWKSVFDGGKRRP